MNTAENIRYTRQLLHERSIRPANIVLAVKPFMQRRTWAAMAVEWPEMPATLASPRMTLDEYFTAELTPAKIVNIMMGDLQRVWVYARRGWSAPPSRASSRSRSSNSARGSWRTWGWSSPGRSRSIWPGSAAG